MANSLLSTDQVTREALRIAHEKLTFIRTINRSYDDAYAKTGAKIGSALRIRKPNQFTVRTGNAMNTQDQSEDSVTMTLATLKGVDMSFSHTELALTIDEFSKRYIEPAMAVLASNVESDVLTSVTKKVYNTVGTAGTVPNDLEIFANAQAKLNQYLAPADDQRSVQVSSITMAKMIGALKGLFQDSASIKKQYLEGIIGRTTMADWYSNERVYRHATGADHTTITVNDTVASGDSTFTTAGATVTVGSVFTIANVNAVHPETKQVYGHVQQFTITAISGNDWTISPAFISTGAKQNIDALPANGAAITMVGSASTTYAQDIMYHKDAFAFVSADLPLMAGADKCVRKEYDGLSLRVWQDGDIRNNEMLMRIDLLYGFEAIRPEFACRITS